MKLKITLTKSMIIDLDEPGFDTQGAAWREALTELLKEDNPAIEIDTADETEVIGAAIREIESDPSMTIADLDITGSDFQVEIHKEEEEKPSNVD